MAARTTNADIVGANDVAFANNLGHYRGRLAAKLAKHLVTHGDQGRCAPPPAVAGGPQVEPRNRP
jgi:hypothetical protein